MAALSVFYISVSLSGTVTNPINTQTYQVITPWGKSSKRSSLREALEDITNRCGSEQAGVMGAYLLNQTTNGLTSGGSVAVPTGANEVGIP
jgi:hypothetical protein